MNRHMIFYIDYEDESTTKISNMFEREFQNYFLNIQTPNANIIENMVHAIKKDYTIPLVFIGDKVLNKLGHNLFYEIKNTLHFSNLIFLSSSDKITNLSKNIKNIGFYTHITKKYLKKNLFLTVNEAIKNYNLNLQLENSYKRDILTGLFNRNALLKDIKKSSNPLVLLINVDDFRNINFTYGYKCGDSILKQFASKLDKLSIYETYRLLSDEFVILCKNIDVSEAYELSNSIRKTIEQTNFTYDNEEINFTISIAISESSKAIIEDAREAIRNSMAIQKNSIIVVTKDKEKKNSDFSTKNLRLAFAKDKIIPFYQGIRNNKTGNIEKYECLVRLKDENDNLVSPQCFLQLAQAMGLISKITRLVIKKSFQYFSKKNGEFSINITEDDLKEHYIVDYLKEMSNEFNIELNRVTFEVLENINTEQSSIIAQQIRDLKALGCKIAFDDFGCEKSNFSRLLDLNIDIVKIDSMFIKNIHHDQKSYKLAKAITRLAKDFDCQVVAEGVECEAAQKIIEELDIDFTQGYFYSKPSENV